MALNLSNSRNLDQLALNGLTLCMYVLYCAYFTIITYYYNYFYYNYYNYNYYNYVHKRTCRFTSNEGKNELHSPKNMTTARYSSKGLSPLELQAA